MTYKAGSPVGGLTALTKSKRDNFSKLSQSVDNLLFVPELYTGLCFDRALQ